MFGAVHEAWRIYRVGARQKDPLFVVLYTYLNGY